MEWGGVKKSLEVVKIPVHGLSGHWPEQSL